MDATLGHILLIDDEEMLVELGCEMLRDLGYEVTGFSQANAAIAALREAPHRFDAVITDQHMPEMLGVNVASSVREICSDIPVVLFTGLSTKLSTAELTARGIVSCVKKPFTLEDLRAAVSAALHSRSRKNISI